MSFIFGRRDSSQAQATAPPTPLPPAPVQIARVTVPEGDGGPGERAEQQRQVRRGGAARRRGTGTLLSGIETVLGATGRKTLLGA